VEPFRPIEFDFNQQCVYDDLIDMNIFDKGFLATVNYNDGRSKWDQGGYFNEYSDVVHYDEDHNIIKGSYNTFVTYNFTHIPGIDETKDNSFINTSDGRKPVWHVYDEAWEWKKDTPEYLKNIVSEFNLEYVSCVRLVGQSPPSKGIVHVDAGYKDNFKYYKNGGVSITLNVSDGGGHLQYRVGEEIFEVDESMYKCWHFDDSVPHCTTEIYSPRIQIRIFGKRFID
jgi:hypothetical protein